MSQNNLATVEPAVNFPNKIWSTFILQMVATIALAQVSPPHGEVTGNAFVHDEISSSAVIDKAQVALPASVTGRDVYLGPYSDIPKSLRGRAPVVVFLHGSSGLSSKAIEEWQRWLAGLGIASFAPDSFELRDRVNYTSPVDKKVYERVHALRSSEISIALKAVGSAPWADVSRMVLAGTSEGGTTVARYGGQAFLGRIIFSWSCESNYFVREHATAGLYAVSSGT